MPLPCSFVTLRVVTFVRFARFPFCVTLLRVRAATTSCGGPTVTYTTAIPHTFVHYHYHLRSHTPALCLTDICGRCIFSLPLPRTRPRLSRCLHIFWSYVPLAGRLIYTTSCTGGVTHLTTLPTTYTSHVTSRYGSPRCVTLLIVHLIWTLHATLPHTPHTTPLRSTFDHPRGYTRTYDYHLRHTYHIDFCSVRSLRYTTWALVVPHSYVYVVMTRILLLRYVVRC